MIGSDNIRKGPDRTWAPRGIGHAVTFRCWHCDRTKSTQGAKLVGRLKLKVCAECFNKGNDDGKALPRMQPPDDLPHTRVRRR